VNAQRTAGWHLLPIYMGTQPYCSSSSKVNRFTGANAASIGRSEAADAVREAQTRGLATGSTIFSDIEGYSTTGVDNRNPRLVCTSAVTTAVRTYQSAWTTRLHELGFLSGFYSSLGSGVRDQVAVYGSPAYVRPDYLWFARYDGRQSVLDSSIPQVLPDTYWEHRRIKQYRGGAVESYGGTSRNVDQNLVDVRPVPATPFGDFQGNGWSDLITRQRSTGRLLLYPGNGTMFGAPARIGAGWNVMSAITRFGDFNRDGHEDLIARVASTGALWLYPGTGSGFARPLRIGISGWNGMREITPVGDLDRDGYPDLVAVQTSTGKLYLYRGRGTSLAPRRLIGAGWNPFSELAGVGDFNRDGRVDLVARESATGYLWLYRSGAGAFGARTRIGTGWIRMRDLVGVGDFDRDGFTDLLAVDGATNQLFRYPGRGTFFGARVLVGTGWTTDLRPLL
jgi:hypothetical protein